MDEATKAILDGQQRQIDEIKQLAAKTSATLEGISKTLEQLSHHEFRLDAHEASIKDQDTRIKKLEGYKWILVILSAVIIGGAVTMVNMSIKMSMTAAQSKPMTQEQYIEASKKAIVEAIKQTQGEDNEP
jgi:septal ring factor EnvC (AmiA/AmiB activator)